MTLVRYVLLAGASAAALCSASASEAQISQAAESNGGAVEEIVVTAERRAENIQAVPITVNAVTGAQADSMGVSGTLSLQTIVPSFTAQKQSGSGARIYIRGVGSPASMGSETSTAFYVDDVYIPANTSAIFNFNAVDQIEVLKGPQGTLFGRNATAGVVLVKTRDPSFETAVDTQIGLANYGTYSGSIYATTKITDNLAVNVAAVGNNQTNGWGRDATTGEDVNKGYYWGVRAKALWQPSDRFHALLTYNYYFTSGDFGLNAALAPGHVAIGNATFTGPRTNFASPSDRGKARQNEISLKMDGDLGFAKLVSVTSYQRHPGSFNIDQDAGPLDYLAVRFAVNETDVTQEIHLLSPNDATIAGRKWSWIAGAFYLHRDIDASLISSGSALAFFGGSRSDLTDYSQQSASLFADTTLEILPKTRLTGGLRYSVDDFNLQTRAVNQAGAIITTGTAPVNACAAALGTPTLVPASSSGIPCTQKVTQSKLTYRGVISHDFTDDVMAYASFSRGFHAGGPSFSAPRNAIVQPEVVDATEIGLKSRWFDHSLQVNLTYYQYHYSNMLVSFPQAGSILNVNAGESRIKGGEIDVTWQATHNFSVRANAGLLYGHFTNYSNGVATVQIGDGAAGKPSPLNTGVNCSTLQPIGNTPFLYVSPTGARSSEFNCTGVNLTGTQLPNTPKISGSVSATYKRDFSIGQIEGTVTYFYTDRYFSTPAPQLFTPAYGLISGSVKWLSPSKRWDTTLWVRNLTNKLYPAFPIQSTTGDIITAGEPRVFGITVGAHF